MSTRAAKKSKNTMTDKPWRVSASQISTWNDCPRKWGLRYIDGIKAPPHPAAALGTEVHAVLETYLKDEGRLLTDLKQTERAMAIAEPVVEHLPPVDGIDPALVEHKFAWVVDDLHFRGVIDLVHVDGEVTIYDHKTSRDPGKWGLTSLSLLEDTQAILYGAYALAEFSLDAVGLQWTYTRTQGKPHAFPVRATMTTEHIEQRLEQKILAPARAITEAKRTKKTGLDLAPEPSACGKYGGCYFAESGDCVLTRPQRLAAIFNEPEKDKPMSNLKDILAARKNAGKPAPPPRVDEQPERRPINAPESPPTLRERLLASKAAEMVNKTGNREEKKDKTHAVAVEAASGGDPQKKAAQLQADEDAQKTSRKSPTGEEVVRLACTRERNRWCLTSKAATPELPYCSARTLNKLKREGLINWRKMDDGTASVMPTDKGIELHAPAPVNVDPNPTGVAAPPQAEPAAQPQTTKPTPPPIEEVREQVERVRGMLNDNAAAQALAIKRNIWLACLTACDGDIEGANDAFEHLVEKFGGDDL